MMSSFDETSLCFGILRLDPGSARGRGKEVFASDIFKTMSLRRYKGKMPHATTPRKHARNDAYLTTNRLQNECPAQNVHGSVLFRRKMVEYIIAQLNQ